MGLMRLLFYFAVGYIIWRIFLAVTRVLNPPQQPSRRPNTGPARSQKAPPQKYSDIQDAEFEDITPKPPKDPNKPPTTP